MFKKLLYTIKQTLNFFTKIIKLILSSIIFIIRIYISNKFS